MRQQHSGNSCVSGNKSNSIRSEHFAVLMYSTLVRKCADAFSQCRRWYVRLSIENRTLEFRLTIVRDFKITTDLFYFSISLTAFYVSPSFCATVPFSRSGECRVGFTVLFALLRKLGPSLTNEWNRKNVGSRKRQGNLLRKCIIHAISTWISQC